VRTARLGSVLDMFLSERQIEVLLHLVTVEEIAPGAPPTLVPLTRALHPEEFGDRFYIQVGAMLHTTDRLETLGLVVRVPDPRGCAPGFRHTIRETWNLDDPEYRVLVTLMRVGPMESSALTLRLQAEGVEVNHPEVLAALRRLRRNHSLVSTLTRPLHQKERIWTQLVGEPRHAVLTHTSGSRPHPTNDPANPVRGGSAHEQMQELLDLRRRLRRLIRQHRDGRPPDDLFF
jgi:DNA-binding MarR family transcriptional regulator